MATDDQARDAAIRRSYWPRKTGNPDEWFSIQWWAGMNKMHAYGGSAHEAIRNCYRVRRARYLNGRSPGWMTDRQHYRWLRLARRIGAVS